MFSSASYIYIYIYQYFLVLFAVTSYIYVCYSPVSSIKISLRTTTPTFYLNNKKLRDKKLALERMHSLPLIQIY